MVRVVKESNFKQASHVKAKSGKQRHGGRDKQHHGGRDKQQHGGRDKQQHGGRVEKQRQGGKGGKGGFMGSFISKLKNMANGKKGRGGKKGMVRESDVVALMNEMQGQGKGERTRVKGKGKGKGQKGEGAWKFVAESGSNKILEKMAEIGAANKVWVGSLNPETTWKVLEKHAIQVLGNKPKITAMLPKAGACIAFDTKQQADEARQILNETELQGSTILVDVWTDKSQNKKGGGKGKGDKPQQKSMITVAKTAFAKRNVEKASNMKKTTSIITANKATQGVTINAAKKAGKVNPAASINTANKAKPAVALNTANKGTGKMNPAANANAANKAKQPATTVAVKQVAKPAVRGDPGMKARLDKVSSGLKVFVGNLKKQTTFQRLRQCFTDGGHKPDLVNLFGDNRACLAFKDEAEAAMAVAGMMGTALDGATLEIDVWSQDYE